MLELKNIKKTCCTNGIKNKTLDNISVSFRRKEFVVISGAGDSGKIAFLNIIGGLERYDEGDLIIKGRSTKQFTDKDWDAYRNNSVGFAFQSYNLIADLSIEANVEMSMMLSRVPKSERRKRVYELLERVGLKDCIHKKPDQLSGGQMQRAAIARALANDPETFLCEDSTGRDTMELIRKISEERLVIMVAHNPETVEKYADRIVRLQDGKIISDSHPLQERPKPDSFNLTKTGMNFTTALSLAFNNIKSKKWRSFLTAVESGVGIISIALIAAMSGRAIENTPALAALAAISFIAGFGMVAFLTYISVLERKEGIGILKVLGAGNKDISRVFNAETFTIGAFSGILGVGIIKLSGAANLQIQYAVIMIIAGAVLTMLCGYIPARMAVKKNIAETLKSD